MTEKQFTVYGKEIVQDDECWAVAYSEYNADVIATALNELAEENKKLQSINQDHCDYIADVEADFVRLEKENKELMKLDENRKEYQRTLESKIRRLKDRIKVLEKR